MPKRTAPSRKPRTAPANAATPLVEALKFVSCAQKKDGTQEQTHCKFDNGFVVASDGIVTAGYPVGEGLHACPHTFKLLDALSRCSEQFAITLDNDSLLIKSGRFRANIPCMPFENLAWTGADTRCATIDDRLKTSIAVASMLIEENGNDAKTASVLVQANTCVGTDGRMLIEHWHGIDLPPGLLLPKIGAKAIVGSPLKLEGFGFSQGSLTVFFDNGAYIKSQLFEDAYPKYLPLFERPVAPTPLPDGFYAALKAVYPFAEHEVVCMRGNVMQSHKSDAIGATYEIDGLPANAAYNGGFFLKLESLIKTVDFHQDRAFFFGDNLRGIIMGCSG